ncbi:MAG: tetratricopeptide repeat protein [Flavobacteriales bacterium]
MNRLSVIFVLLIVVACKAPQAPVVTDTAYIKQFHTGVRAMLNEQHEEALAAFKICLQQNPKDAALHFAMFETYLKQEKYAEAVYHTEQAAALDPKNLHYKRELAFMYSQMGKFTEAAEVFEALLKVDPMNLDYYSGGLQAYQQLQKPAKSLALIQKMEQAMGANPNTVLEKFKLYGQMGKEKEALLLLETARNDFPQEPSILANLVDYYFKTQNYKKGFEILKDLVVADPSNGVASLMYGEMLYRSGDRMQGKKYMHAGILAEGPSLDQKMNILIMLLNEQQTPDTSLEPLVNYMTETFPNEAKSHSIAGDYYYKAGSLPKAIAAYQQTVKIDPNLYPVWNQILLLEFEVQKWSSLEKDAKEAALIFPNQPLPYFFIALAANRALNFQLALENLDLCANVLVNDPGLLAEVWVQRGTAMLGLGQTTEGLGYFKNALDQSKSNPAVELQYIHQLLLHQIELNSAMARIQELRQQAPTNDLYKQEEAFAYFQSENFQQGLQLLQTINNTNLLHSSSYLELLGDFQFKIGAKNEALQSWQRAKEFGDGSIRLNEKIETKNYVKAL